MLRTLFSIGFRPMFLLAGAWAAAAILLWVAMLHGAPLRPALPGVLWHAHELLWGFLVAVIAGFLLTAVQNWTGQRTVVGGALAALAALWVAGRLVVTFGEGLPWGVVAAVDVAFLPALALAIGRPLVATRNARNYAFPLLLLVLAAANLAVHVAAAGRADPLPVIRTLGLDVVAMLVVIVGGRIIPLFTRNALPHVPVDPHGIVNASAVWVMGALLVADALALGLPGLAGVAGIVAIGAGVLNGLRMVGWQSLATVRHPILWVLHLAYALLAVSLVLRGVSALDPSVPSSLGTHLLTIGALGLICLGMMSRVALGHSGRPLQISRWIAGAYGLVVAAALVRTGGILAPRWLAMSWDASATLFALAFVIFVVVYAPILLTPRADGRADP